MRGQSLPLPAFVLAVPLLLAGCGDRPPADPTDAGASSRSTPTPASSTTGTADPRGPTSPVGPGPLAAFPLDLGYAEKNGDDGSPVEITTTPATTRFASCDRLVWDPRKRTTDLIGVEFRGEAESFRGRTLVLYPDADTARASVTAARTAVAACPDESDGKGQGTTHTVTGRALGEQSVVWTDTFYSVHDSEQPHDTGLVVYLLVRVGRAVLLCYEYGEGNGSPTSREQAIDRSTREERRLMGPLHELARDPA